MAYTAALPRRATSHASATASSSVELPFTGTRIRLARITAPHFLALRCGWVKPSYVEPPGSPQQADHAHAVLDASVHRRVDRLGQRQAAGEQGVLGPVPAGGAPGRGESTRPIHGGA